MIAITTSSSIKVNPNRRDEWVCMSVIRKKNER
jgi:hypothetical protein